jgi:hypothetical protein
MGMYFLQDTKLQGFFVGNTAEQIIEKGERITKKQVRDDVRGL